jgi:NitT/TauT family transport system substrate-binding protein
MCKFLNAVTAALIIGGLGSPAAALDLLRVGKAVPEAFSFVPLDVGVKKGLFQKDGLDVQSIAFGGDAKLQQAMAADGVDIGLGSGPGMAFIAKGSPVKAVAAMAGPPLLLAVIVRPDGGVNSVADLKGKRVGVTTVGSVTNWLTTELSRQQGWGADGIIVTPMGATQAQIVALERKDIDGVTLDIATALQLERAGKAKILVRLGRLVKDFHIHIIFATDKVIAARPNAVRAFLKGWFESIAFMHKNKDATVAIATDVIQTDADITAKAYDELMPMFSEDGRFNPKALATLAKSYVEMKILPTEPDMAQLYTEQFLPQQSSPQQSPSQPSPLRLHSVPRAGATPPPLSPSPRLSPSQSQALPP